MLDTSAGTPEAVLALQRGLGWTDWGTKWRPGADFGNKSRDGKCAQHSAPWWGSALSRSVRTGAGNGSPGELAGQVYQGVANTAKTWCRQPVWGRACCMELVGRQHLSQGLHLPKGSCGTFPLGREANRAAAWRPRRGLTVAPVLPWPNRTRGLRAGLEDGLQSPKNSCRTVGDQAPHRRALLTAHL